MDVHLSPDVEKIVRKRLQTGRYASASEVVNEALQALEERDRIRSKIDEGLRSLQAGRAIAEDDAFEQLKAKHEQYKRNR